MLKCLPAEGRAELVDLPSAGRRAGFKCYVYSLRNIKPN